MQKPLNLRNALANSRQRVCVCLLLAGLLLYNPFLVALGSGAGLNVHHPASHRATVGSSELQQFSSAAGQDSVAFTDSSLEQGPSFLPVLTGMKLLHSSPQVFPAQQFLCASLWFRPPPAA
jgi:hypothetical protein